MTIQCIKNAEIPESLELLFVKVRFRILKNGEIKGSKEDENIG